MQYLVTTDSENLPQVRIAMVDGTVPGWEPRRDGIDDLHYDHHRPSGGRIQIDEMENAPFFERGCIVTTLCDADAICAAAWLQLTQQEREANYQKMWAIAHDCDYLWCPNDDLAEFAAKAVAALKLKGFSVASTLGLPEDRKIWTSQQKVLYSSEAFRLGAEWILDACRNGQPWPGELGEADEYWQTLERDAAMLIQRERISILDGIGIVDLRSLGRYIDPRAQQKALIDAFESMLSGLQLSVTYHKNGGIQYTLGSIPKIAPVGLDYTADVSIFWVLTQWEAAKRGIDTALSMNNWGNSDFEATVGFSPWGGRAVVGGSGWNTASTLLPHEVVARVNDWLHN